MVQVLTRVNVILDPRKQLQGAKGGQSLGQVTPILPLFLLAHIKGNCGVYDLSSRCGISIIYCIYLYTWRFSCCVFSPTFDQKHVNAKETCAKHVSVMFSGLGPRGRHCSKRLNRQACFILPPCVNPMQCRCTQISTHCIGASANVMTPGSYITHAPDKVLIAKAIVDF